MDDEGHLSALLRAAVALTRADTSHDLIVERHECEHLYNYALSNLLMLWYIYDTVGYSIVI